MLNRVYASRSRTAEGRTHFLDEIDAWAGKDYCRGVLNAGFKPGGCVIRMKPKKTDKNSTLLDGVTLHTLRQTFGSWKLEEGCNVVYVSKQMGHARVSITANVYAHLVDEFKPQAAAKTDSLLFPATATTETAATMIN